MKKILAILLLATLLCSLLAGCRTIQHNSAHCSTTVSDTADSSAGAPTDQVSALPVLTFSDSLAETKSYIILSFTYTSEDLTISGYCKVKAQGSSSMAYPKKNQTIKFYEDADCTKKLKLELVEGWGAQHKYCLKANWIDITHARNIVSARLWADVVASRSDFDQLPDELRSSPNLGAIDGFMVTVYAGGVYQGRYTLNIPKDGWMLNMDSDNPNHCILMGRTNSGAAYFQQEAIIDGTDWSDELHDTVPKNIVTRWNKIINWVQNATDEEFRKEIDQYFDMQSLVDYLLFSIASNNRDGFGKNQIYYTYDGLKWYVSAYDLDSTWGLFWNGRSYTAINDQYYLGETKNLLYRRVSQVFWPELAQRWQELRAGVLSLEHITQRFLEFTNQCPQELIALDYAPETANGAYTQIPQVESNTVDWLLSYASARLTWADRLFGIDSAQGDGTAYTNQLSIAIDETGEIYNSIGYRLDTIIDSLAEEENIGTVLTGYIPCTDGDTIRLYNMSFIQDDAACRLYFYDADKNLIGFAAANSSLYMDNMFTGILDEDGNYTSFQIFDSSGISTGCAYIRICCRNITEESIITINQPIDSQ